MSNFLLVKVAHCLRDQVEHLEYLVVVQGAVLRYVFIEGEEAFEVLHDHVALRSFFVCVVLVNLGDIWVIQLLEQIILVSSQHAGILAHALLEAVLVAFDVLDAVH